jgi:glutaredoxin
MDVVRCEKHDLACGPSGRCVLCARSDPPELSAPLPRWLPWLIAASALAMATGVTYRLIGAARPIASTPTPAIRADLDVPTGPITATRATATALAQFPPTDPNTESRLHWLKAVAAGTANAPESAPTTQVEARPIEGPAPIATAERVSIRDVAVIVYTTSWCPVCRQAKGWLNSNGVAYEERNIETSTEYARKMKALNPRGSIPTIDIDGDILVGFAESTLSSTLERAAQRRSARRRM